MMTSPPQSELNNNISAGRSVTKSTGCIHGFDDMDCQLASIYLTDTSNSRSCALDYTHEDCCHTSKVESLDRTKNSHGAFGLDSQDLPEVSKCLQGRMTKDNTRAAGNIYRESVSGEFQDIKEEKMRNCSCDEGFLCFCPSSVFKGGLKQKTRELLTDSMASRPKERVSPVDEVFKSDVELNSQKMDETNGVVAKDSEEVKECKGFMEDLVDRIFNNSASIGQEDNAKFGEYCQSAIGRQWFARLVDGQRVNSKNVNEQTFYRLVQFFAVCLFECSNADDFTPGKSLMNMCFTFYHEHEGFPRCDATTQKCFLYSQLTEQPIWKSLRFWNAAFFDAVHQERKQRSPGDQVNWRHLSSEERESSEILNENITFGQLATFLHNMMELGLSQDICQEFLDKMATIGNLSPDQKDLIQSNIENHFDVKCQEDLKTKRPHRPFNKLNFMKRRSGRDSRYSVP